MPFINKIDYKENKSKYRRTEFLSLPTNTTSIIRILEEEATDFRTHYINGCTVKCLEEDCPICAINRELIMKYPEEFRDDPSYIARQTRYYINVYDKTLAKHCDACGTDTKDLSKLVCYKCKRVLPTEDAKPINKVKVLSKGPTPFGLLDDVNSAVLSDPSDPESIIGLSNYDVSLVIRGTGKDTTTTPIPNQAANEEVVLSEGDSLYDLDEALISLEASEMLELREGVSLRDIFIARSANRASEEKVATLSNKAIEVDNDAVNEEFKAQVESRVRGLFSRRGN